MWLSAGALLAALPDPALLLSVPEEGQEPAIIDCNEALAGRCGYTRAELVGARAGVIGIESMNPTIVAAAVERMARGERLEEIALWRHRDGRIRPTPVSVSLVAEGDSRAMLIVERTMAGGDDTLLARERQAREHEALARFLQTLQQQGDDALSRRALLDSAADYLAHGASADRALVYEIDEADGDLRLDLFAAPDPPPSVPASVGWSALPPAVRAAITASVPSPVRLDDGITYSLFPIVIDDRPWGGLALGFAPGRGPDRQAARLAQTGADIIGSTIRRWLAVDALLASRQALRESEGRLQRLADALPALVWMADISGETIFFNQHYADFVGLPVSALSGQLIMELTHPDDLRISEDVYRRGVRSRTPFAHEWRLRHADGTYHWLLEYGVPNATPDGELLGFVGICLDITEQKRTEAALRASEERLRHALDAGRMIAWEADVATGRLMTEGDPRFIGTPTSPAYVGDYLSDVHPEDVQRVRDTFASGLAGGPIAVEYRILNASGQIEWREIRSRLVPQIGDQPQKLAGISADITDRKRIELALRESEERFRGLTAQLERRVRERTEDLSRTATILETIVTSLDDGLALIGRDGELVMFNPALPALYQRPPPSLRARTWREICPSSAGLVELTFRDHRPLQDRIQIAGAEGRTATIDVRTFPLVDSDGSVSQVVLHLTDTTERTQFEALALKNERLAASGRLAAIVAHEVNTPLQALQNFVYLAATDNAAERDAYLSMVGDEIERIGVLIRRLLDIHREGDGAAKAIDVADLVDRVLTLVGGTLTRRRVQVARDIAPLLPPVLGRSDQLTQVLLNLIINARDAMLSGGTLTVRIRSVQAIFDSRHQGAPALLIEVADSGAGIAPSALPRIFEPFFTTKPDGSGLGLPISRQIVEQHGGRLAAANGPAGGAVFQILLPAFTPPQ